MIQSRDVTILLIEDDEVDVRLVQRSFKQQQFAAPIVVASDGIEALAMLRGEAGKAPLPQPYLILLDLNLPRMNGMEFLKTIRADATLHTSVIFVLTTSDDDRDKLAAYHHHIAGYLLKAHGGVDLWAVGRLIEHYVSAVQFPPVSNA